MDNSSPVILDISSDEEVGFGGTVKGSGIGVGGEFGEIDFEFLSKLLEEAGGSKAKEDGCGSKDDDSDDVVFMSEVIAKPPKKLRVDPLKPVTRVVNSECDDGDDDDCVVLDGDPDKPVVVASSKVDDDGGSDSDELEIVGEKGEVACRDFPHSRHLCAKFLFASTPHEVHCGQCHCFVCDARAPCLHWGTGISSIDHCHATDKEEYWRSERKLMQKGDKPKSVTPTSEAFFQSAQLSAISPPLPNILPQNQRLRPHTTHPCPISPNVSVPKVINHNRSHLSGCAALGRPPTQLISPPPYSTSNNNAALKDRRHPTQLISPPPYSTSNNNAALKDRRHPTQLISQPPHSTSNNKAALKDRRHPTQLISQPPHSTSNNNAALKDRRHIVGNRSARFFHPGATLKRAGFVGTSPNNKRVHRYEFSKDTPIRRYHAYRSHVTNGHHDLNQRGTGTHIAHSVLPQPTLGTTLITEVPYAIGVPSQPQMCSQPYSSSVIGEPIHFQSETPSQPYVSGNCVNPVPTQPVQPQLTSQPIVENYENVILPQPPLFQPYPPLPSLRLPSYQSNSSNAFGNQIPSRTMVGNNLENQSSQPRIHDNPTSSLIDGQDDSQQVNHPQNIVDASQSYSEFAWDSSLGLGNPKTLSEVLQSQSTRQADSSEYQSVTEENCHQSIVSVDNVHRLSVAPADNSSLVNVSDCQFPRSSEPESLGFQNDSWIFENHSSPGALDIPVSPVWDVFSPEPSSIDTGTPFDI